MPFGGPGAFQLLFVPLLDREKRITFGFSIGLSRPTRSLQTSIPQGSAEGPRLIRQTCLSRHVFHFVRCHHSLSQDQHVDGIYTRGGRAIYSEKSKWLECGQPPTPFYQLSIDFCFIQEVRFSLPDSSGQQGSHDIRCYSFFSYENLHFLQERIVYF